MLRKKLPALVWDEGRYRAEFSGKLYMAKNCLRSFQVADSRCSGQKREARKKLEKWLGTLPKWLEMVWEACRGLKGALLHVQ